MEQDRERCQHRPLAFDKMEGLVREMQTPGIGIEVGLQKLFLTSFPASFVGYDLIEWLMERLSIEESEALNIANQLCQYGYLFPVSDYKNLVVKDDSSLYRFQSPYFWPLTRKQPDNIEYLIYLKQREMRRNQRHTLEDYELEAKNNLEKNLANKVHLVMRQAEHRIAAMLNRSKIEKIIYDSQERAYWRIHRPPPGFVSPLEQCPVPNRIQRVRKRTIEDCKKEVKFVKSCLSRTRIKVSTALTSMATYVETYQEYDPLMTGVQPSNPWISEDLTYWQINAPLVDNPTEKRIKRWALSMEELVSDPTGLHEFTNYLRKEYSHENIRFWLAVNDLRRSSHSQIQRKVCEIFEEFLAPGAPCEINIDGKTMEKVHHELITPTRFTFDSAAEHVYTLLLKKDCYPRFVRSEHYKNLLAAGIQPLHKKRFFGFVGPTKKKQSTATIQNQSILEKCGGGGSSGASGPTLTSNASGNASGSGGVLGRRRGSDRSLSGSAHELAVSGVRDISQRVPHSHSQSNLTEIPYREVAGLVTTAVSSSSTETTVTTAGDTHPNVCPWETNDSEPTPSPSQQQQHIKHPSISEDITVPSCSWNRSRKNSQYDSGGSSSSDLSSHILADVTERLKRTCGLQQQKTIDSDTSLHRNVHNQQNPRKLSTVACIESARRSSISVITTTTIPASLINTKQFITETVEVRQSAARPSVSSIEDEVVTSPCNPHSLVSDNISDNKQGDNKQLKTTSSVCSAVTPIISVSSVVDDNVTITDSVVNTPEFNKDDSTITEEEALESVEVEEEQQLHADRDQLSSSVCIPFLALAPLAEPDGGSPLSDYPIEELLEDQKEFELQEEAEAEKEEEGGGEEEVVVVEEEIGKTPTASGATLTKKNSDVCPWEDEESCKVDTPFVKTYATLGYL